MERNLNIILEQLKKYKKKRDLNLFFLLVGVVFSVIVYLVFHLLGVDFSVIAPIMMLLIIGLTVAILIMRPKILTYSMYYKYYKMLADNQGPLTVNVKPFTKTFIKKLNEMGFDSNFQTNNFIIHYKIYDKLKDIRSKGKAIVFAVMAKNDQAKFYSGELDTAIEQIVSAQKKPIKRQIVLQFKKYSSFNQVNKEEMDQVINLVDGGFVLIHLTCGIMLDTNQIYFLRPKKVYPNKFYYYGSKLIYELTSR